MSSKQLAKSFVPPGHPFLAQERGAPTLPKEPSPGVKVSWKGPGSRQCRDFGQKRVPQGPKTFAILPAQVWSYGALVLVGVFFLASCAGSQTGRRTGPSDPVLQKGEALYQANCQSCHGGATGGKLRDIPPPHNSNGHTWHHADQQLLDMVLNGIPSLEEQKMPTFKDKLTEEDVKALLAYIKTWWTEEQRQFQANATAQWER